MNIDINVCLFFFARYSLNEVLATLEDEQFLHASMYLTQPGSGVTEQCQMKTPMWRKDFHLFT